jgi:hypothetical protein
MFAGFAHGAGAVHQSAGCIGWCTSGLIEGQADTPKTIGYLADLMVLRCQVEPNLTFREIPA